MVIKTIPENLWEEYSKQSSGKSKNEVETILNELFSDECNNLTEVTVRQLQGGKFGAHLFLASYTANQNTRKDWVIKFVEPKKIHLIQKERHAIEKLVNKIQPGVKIRVSVNGAIAYPFIKSEFNFDDLLLEASFSPPSIFYQQLFIYPEYPHVIINNRKKYTIPIFVKIKVEKEFPVAPGNVEDTEYLWVKKIPLIKKGIIKGKEVACNQENLKKYVEQDRTTCEFGLDVLECTDTIFFRENSDKDYEFLLLHRQEFKDPDKGWEYPKGGMEYHETINEGAIRELPVTHLLIFCGIRKKFHTE